MAKIQLSTTWECGAMPFIPVLNLLAEKFVALRNHRVEGAMQSWTLGSCPSINTELADLFNWNSTEDPESWLKALAVSRYGEEAAPEVLESWRLFSEAFADYPFSNPIVYSSQVLWGPAHPLYFHESHRRPSLQNSRDSFDWTRPYGPEVTSRLFRQLENRWNAGVTRLQSALKKVTSDRESDVHRDIGVARAFGLHMGSVANQIDFLLARRVFRDGSQEPAERIEALRAMRTIAENERSKAAELLAICMKDSRIGFEAFFQYVYRPQDIREKILSCEYLLQRVIPAEERRLLSR